MGAPLAAARPSRRHRASPPPWACYPPMSPRRPNDGRAPARAGGARFTPRSSNIDERKRLILDALALGGGYVELCDSDGGLHRSLGPRLVDLKRGLVAPMIPAPFHFSRHHRGGQCAMCKWPRQTSCLRHRKSRDRGTNCRDGSGRTRSSIRAAASVMKGVGRASSSPSSEALAEEGLWERSTPFRRSRRGAVCCFSLRLLDAAGPRHLPQEAPKRTLPRSAPGCAGTGSSMLFRARSIAARMNDGGRRSSSRAPPAPARPARAPASPPMPSCSLSRRARSMSGSAMERPESCTRR